MKYSLARREKTCEYVCLGELSMCLTKSTYKKINNSPKQSLLWLLCLKKTTHRLIREFGKLFL